MQTDSLNIPVFYMRQLRDHVELCGVNIQAWLANNGLSEEKLHNPEGYFSYPQYASLITSAVELCDQPELGLYVGQRLGITTHGMMGYAIISSNSIREALELLAKFLITRTPLVNAELLEKNETIQLILKNSLVVDRPQVSFMEALILTLKNTLDQISFDRVIIQRVCFPYPAPEYENIYHEIFSCPLEFEHEYGMLEISLKGIDQQLRQADPTSLQQAKALCEVELDKILHSDSLSNKIRKLLLHSIGNFPSLAQVASHFHMTPRTLHRQLLKEKSSYKIILQEVRSKLAIEYLKKSNMKIEEISFLLGYLDIANFRRAFKRWHGIPPGEYRQLHQQYN